MRRMVHKPVVPLGGKASLCEEAAHFIHHMGNQLMVLMMMMEMRAAERKERRAAYAARMERRNKAAAARLEKVRRIARLIYAKHAENRPANLRKR